MQGECRKRSLGAIEPVPYYRSLFAVDGEHDFLSGAFKKLV